MPSILKADFFKRYGPDAPIQSLMIHQKVSNHTLVWIDYNIETISQYYLPDPGSPLTVQWGDYPLGVKTLYGYLNHYETTNDSLGNTYLRVVAMGTSKGLNSVVPTNWSDTTRSGMARDIAKRHKWRSVIHPHPYVVPNWASGALTEFQALKKMGDEIGYHLWVDGSTLFFLDPKKLLTSAASAAVPTFVEDEIRSIRILGGTDAPGVNGPAYRKVIYGLDYKTNSFFESSAGPSGLPVRLSEQTALTYADAEDVAASLRRQTIDTYTAQIQVNGDARVRPGGLVNLVGGSLTPDQSGLWTVTAARHEIDNVGYYQSYLEAIRDTINGTSLDTVSTVTGSVEQTGAVVRDGSNWEAVVQEHLNV